MTTRVLFQTAAAANIRCKNRSVLSISSRSYANNIISSTFQTRCPRFAIANYFSTEAATTGAIRQAPHIERNLSANNDDNNASHRRIKQQSASNNNNNNNKTKQKKQPSNWRKQKRHNSPRNSKEEDGNTTNNVNRNSTTTNDNEYDPTHPYFNTCWISVPSTPLFATLDDVLWGVEQTMESVKLHGISDLDYKQKLLENENDNENIDEEKETYTDLDFLKKMTNNDQKGINTALHYNKEMTNDDHYYDEELRGSNSRDAELASHHEQQEQKDSLPPMLDLEQFEHLAPHMVLEARSTLSLLKRPTGWYLRFPNRSIAHALLTLSGTTSTNKHHETESHVNNNNESLSSSSSTTRYPIQIGWKFVHPKPFYPHDAKYLKRSLTLARELNISDNVIRIENVPSMVQERHIRKNMLQKYEHTLIPYALDYTEQQHDNKGKSNFVNTANHLAIQRVVKAGTRSVGFSRERDPPKHSVYLVRFDSASSARRVVREMQGFEMMGEKLLLAQYPRQFLPVDE